MKTSVLIAKFFVATSVLLWLITPLQAQDEVHQSYDLNPSATISVANHSGFIHLTGWNENRVQLDAVKRGAQEDFPTVEIKVMHSLDKLEINTIYPLRSWKNSRHVEVEYELKVPRIAILNAITTTSGDITITDAGSRTIVRSTSGNITVHKIGGDTNLNTTSGNISAAHIGGTLTINSTSGELRISDVTSRLSAQATSGNITALDLHDDVAVNAMSGDVRLEKIGGRINARAISGKLIVRDAGGDATLESISDSILAENIKGRVTVTAVSANATIRNVQEGARAGSVSGSILITNVKGLIEAESTNGDLSLRDVDSHEVHLNSHSGSVNYQGAIYDDGRYSFESFNGSVTIYIPTNSNFSVSAKSFSGEISNDFDLKSTGTRPTRLQGSHGKESGANITIVSFSSEVNLRRKK